MEDYEKSYEELKTLIGEEEFIKVNTYLNMTKNSINDIYDHSNTIKGYKKDVVDKFMDTQKLSTETILNRLAELNKDLKTEEYINSLKQHSKDGQDKTNTNYMNKGNR